MNVTVIVPAHNAADTLADTLESLTAQTFPGWEAIVVNDGSTDATPGIVEGFAAFDPRFRLVHRVNGGLAAARNTGVSHARHDALLFLDADDWILPRHL
jgi:glycosyltransferase involved in cell wall biosynthesis